MSQPLPTLLLVDDDDVEAESFKRSLKRSGFGTELLRAKDGLEALEILRGTTVGPMPRSLIVLLDLNMPRMNGFEFLRELRNDPWLRSTVVFVLTTSNAEKDSMEAYDLFISGYIVKSSTGQSFNTLLQLLESYGDSVLFPTTRKIA